MATKNLKVVSTSNETGPTPAGSYYVRDQRGKSWSLYHRVFIGKSKRVSTRVPDLALSELGFRLEMTIEEARKRCARLNQENSIHKDRARKAAARLTRLESEDGVYFPKEYIEGFDALLERENQGTAIQLQKLYAHFRAAQLVVKDLKLLPHEYAENAKSIYAKIVKSRISYEYSLKLIALLNRYSRFVCRKEGRFYDEIPRPRGITRQRIVDSNSEKDGVRRSTNPLSPDDLIGLKSKLPEKNYNWMFISVWFGLRPTDFKGIQTPPTVVNDTGDRFLVVYQSKLTSVEKSKRYKYIPIICREQETAVVMIENGNFKTPTYKTLKNIQSTFRLYSGRKGFVDLMLGKGYAIEDISIWLGHTSIETTWTHYKQKNALNLPKPKKRG